MSDVNIAVLGAGVSGLTTALLLSRNSRYKVTVVAKHLPGDLDICYTSPWAGALVLPSSSAAESSSSRRWEATTWPVLSALAAHVPQAGIHYRDTIVYTRKQDNNSIIPDIRSDPKTLQPWWTNLLPNFKIIKNDPSFPPGVEYASTFTSVCINPSLYLPYLQSQCLRNGVTFKRYAVSHIAELTSLHSSRKPATVIVNCSGLLASSLNGVNDPTVVPVRGQTVLVRQEVDAMVTCASTDDADDELVYVMQRAAGGGTILGGSYQIGNSSPDPDMELAKRIMKRCIALCPSLVGNDREAGIEVLDVVTHGVGLRPYRKGGTRVEKEVLDAGIVVVHNYGHGGEGYQTSYGCAGDVVRIIDSVFDKGDPEDLSQRVRAKL